MSTVGIPVVAMTLNLVGGYKSFASTGSNWTPRQNNSDSKTAAQTKPVAQTATVRKDHDFDVAVSPFSPGSHNVSLDLGQVFLMGDLSKYTNNVGTQVHYTYGVSDLFGFEASAGYSGHSDGRFSMTSVLSGLRMNLSWYDKLIPYGIFGLGFYRPSFSDTSGLTANSGTLPPASSVSAILFGAHAGGGIDLELSRNFYFGTALTFYNMFGTTKEFANGSSVNIGGSYASFFLHTGMTF